MLRKLPIVTDPNVLVGSTTNDDAAVYRLSDEQAIVATVDYIAPVVDDPYAFGQVAAANALSDVYAMGARPIFALNLVGFPREKLPMEMLGEILRGGADKAAEAGVSILGGHSIDDPEPKYGLAVIGLVHPDRIITNVGARPGDRLILTKPLCSGILTTAIKRGLTGAAEERELLDLLCGLNRAASEAAIAVGVHAGTDITGFGLLGHLHEMVGGGGVAARISMGAVPVLPAVWSLVRRGVYPGGTVRNLDHVNPNIRWHLDITEEQKLVLADAQTSGGLLLAVAPDRADRLMGELEHRGVRGAIIGTVVEDHCTIEVVP